MASSPGKGSPWGNVSSTAETFQVDDSWGPPLPGAKGTASSAPAAKDSKGSSQPAQAEPNGKANAGQATKPSPPPAKAKPAEEKAPPPKSGKGGAAKGAKAEDDSASGEPAPSKGGKGPSNNGKGKGKGGAAKGGKGGSATTEQSGPEGASAGGGKGAKGGKGGGSRPGSGTPSPAGSTRASPSNSLSESAPPNLSKSPLAPIKTAQAAAPDRSSTVIHDLALQLPNDLDSPSVPVPKAEKKPAGPSNKKGKGGKNGKNSNSRGSPAGAAPGKAAVPGPEPGAEGTAAAPGSALTPAPAPEADTDKLRAVTELKDYKLRVAAAESQVAILQAQLAVARRSANLEAAQREELQDRLASDAGTDPPSRRGSVDSDSTYRSRASSAAGPPESPRARTPSGAEGPALEQELQLVKMKEELVAAAEAEAAAIRAATQKQMEAELEAKRAALEADAEARIRALQVNMKEELVAVAEAEAAAIRAATQKQMEAELEAKRAALEADAEARIRALQEQMAASNSEGLDALQKQMLAEMHSARAELEAEAEERVQGLRGQVLALAESEVAALKTAQEARSEAMVAEAETARVQRELLAQVESSAAMAEAHSTHVGQLQAMLDRAEGKSEALEARVRQLTDPPRSPTKTQATNTGAASVANRLETPEKAAALLAGAAEAVLFLGFGARGQYKDVRRLLLQLGPMLSALNARARRTKKPWIAVFGGDTAVPDKPDLGMLMKLVHESCDGHMELLAVTSWPEVDPHVKHQLSYQYETDEHGNGLWGGMNKSGKPVGATKFYLQEPMLPCISSIVVVGGGAIAVEELQFAQLLSRRLPVWYLQAELRIAGSYSDPYGPVNQWYAHTKSGPKQKAAHIRMVEYYGRKADAGVLKRAADAGMGVVGGVVLAGLFSLTSSRPQKQR